MFFHKIITQFLSDSIESSFTYEFPRILGSIRTSSTNLVFYLLLFFFGQDSFFWNIYNICVMYIEYRLGIAYRCFAVKFCCLTSLYHNGLGHACNVWNDVFHRWLISTVIVIILRSKTLFIRLKSRPCENCQADFCSFEFLKALKINLLYPNKYRWPSLLKCARSIEIFNMVDLKRVRSDNIL